MMVTADELHQLYQYYDDQSKTPFVGAIQAKKFAKRLGDIINAPNKQKLLFTIQRKDPAVLMRMVREYSEENWHLMMMIGEVPISDVPAEPIPPPEPVCTIDADPFDPPKVRWEFDKREARWIVYVDYQQVMKRVGTYIYKEQAKTVAHALARNKPEQLREVWKVL